MIPLEDGFADILGKAHRGLRLSNETVAKDAGIDAEAYEKVRAGAFDEEIVRKAAPLLGLDPDRLAAIGKGGWHPKIRMPRGVDRATTEFREGTVNAYVIWDPVSLEAAIFDTGMDSVPLLKIVKENGLRTKHLFLTHTHVDHIAEMPNLAKATELVPHVHKSEDIGGVSTFEWGAAFPLGGLSIQTRRTTGHAEGGTTYVVTGEALSAPVAIVGDALFAGSMGGGMVSYEDALKTNRESIFTLPDATLLCPGHGPVTTVGLEKKHNPFYREN